MAITAQNGEAYTDPSRIKILRDENTELFYCLLEDYMEMQERESDCGGDESTGKKQ